MKLVTITPTYHGVTRYLTGLNLSKKSKILDAGFGTGKLASFWDSNGYNVLGIDISEEALALTQSKGIQVKKADILEGLLFEDNTFDLVYSDGLLEHFSDPTPLLIELSRVSNKYVISFVPRTVFYSTIIARLLKAPREFKRPDDEWIQLHSKIPNSSIRSQKIKFGLPVILVEVKK